MDINIKEQNIYKMFICIYDKLHFEYIAMDNLFL